MLAAVKVIPQEHPNIKCRSIDVKYPASTNGQDLYLIERILAEITSMPSGESVAYRGRHRWVQTYEATKMEGSADKTADILPMGGTYLITGGLGDMGLVLAEYLARSFRAKLVLTGRSYFPAKIEWRQWLATHDASDDIYRKIRKIQKIESLGAEVIVFEADVSNLKHMQAVMSKIYERFGRLSGVIHAAGIVKGESFQSLKDIDPNSCNQQFLPKVRGLNVLEKVLRGKKLAFCLLTSSLASVLGGLRFAGYCAANIYMDAFAQKCQRVNGAPWISVNWDAWKFGKEENQGSSRGAGLIDLAITPEEGAEAFGRILPLKAVPQIVVSTGSLQARLKQWLDLEWSKDAKPSLKEEIDSRHERPDISTNYVAPRSECEQAVAEIWQEMLGIKRVGIYDNYFDLGGDSLLATQIIHRIREIFRIQISVDKFFKGASVASLADTIGAVVWAKQSQLKALNGVQQEFEEI
jgi:NAD(P)-dependent dehydrogenase (short-subunit alcohol dehydrogenase family)/acyl carrier protein